jgi:hypothetical protein
VFSGIFLKILVASAKIPSARFCAHARPVQFFRHVHGKRSHANADSFDEKEGRYRGLRCGQMVSLSDSEPTGLQVKPDVAAKQQEAERPPAKPRLFVGNGVAELSARCRFSKRRELKVFKLEDRFSGIPPGTVSLHN